MRRLDEIERQIRELSADELKELRTWFLEQDWQTWDAQILSDSESGKLDKLVADAHAEYDKGQARKF